MNSSCSLGFTTQPREIQQSPLSVNGQIPSWLSGTLVRNGPAKFEVGTQHFRHWFDGLAMLHRFAFREGQVSYSNRFLRSRAYEQAMETGKIARQEFATNPQWSLVGWLWSLFRPTLTDNACVNVSVIDGTHVAMTETASRIAFSLDTLNTEGPFQYSDALKGQVTTAHPHYDFERRECVSFVTHVARKSAYHVYRIEDGQRRRETLARVPVQEPGYMHSFSMTENYVILVEYPLLARPLDLFLGRRPFIENYRWKPDRGARLIVIERNGHGVLGVCSAEPFFAFHQVNAYEQEGEIVLDVAAYEDRSVIDALYLDRLRDEASAIPVAKLNRYRISPGGSAASREPVMDLSVELPRINYRACNMKFHRFVFGVSRTAAARGMYNSLVKADLETEEAKEWSEEGCFPGEPVLVVRPDATAEDEGVILSVLLDLNEQKSFLLVLDARTFKELARARVPQHIPFGFHGQFYAAVSG